ncbi:MlaD family protein [Azospirillum picis]|uniref:Phospholipid/cholesterol/gamma-HCH transport system substrate-binding protein n=1 Tax=Azospirillum picis TaxID=488438 RepID=A0ABU0MP47_9PROT|nr:MlaD family protein [Azospirillum picis]MBP2301401.1 phospholipid/cholesterol/gamma-HCH transport system substrate-binding protein [Azospirillum picis]MDQ0535232.1 phospholipid/cholesterol/gamma-HCH transport system substrate-binding protein [Azospirillum picis]
METRASYILVGSFVLALVAGLLVFTAWVAKVQLDESRETYRIYFNGSVTGLQQGSPVRYRGVPVGTVSDIRLDPENVTRVRVTVLVQNGTPIMADSIASLELQGITGGAYVQISGGAAGGKRLTATDADGVLTIPSRPSSLTAVVDSAPQLVNRALEVVTRLGDLLNGENQKAIGEILANVRTLSAELARAGAGLEETMDQARRTLSGLDGVGPQLNRTLEQARGTLATVDGSARQLTGDTRELMRTLKRTSDTLNALADENREPVRDFTATGLYELTLLITQLRDLSGQLSRVVTRIENDPSNFLFGGTRQGVEVRGK